MVRLGGFLLVGAACLACGSSPEPDDGASGGSSGVGGASAGRAGSSGGAAPEGGTGAAEGGESGETGGGTAGSGGSGAAGGIAPQGGSTPQGGSAGSEASGGSSGAPPVCEEECESGACLEDGTCVECTDEGHCGGDTPRCDTSSNVCVECLPSGQDCGAGRYCSEELRCEKGCGDGASCSSGVCNAQHDCERCLNDDECGENRVCSTGVCLEPCSEEGADCGDGRTCCSGRCVDQSRDITHCGACAGANAEATCDTSEFCGGEGCLPVQFANVCAHPRITVMRGALEPDYAAGDRVAEAFAACPEPPSVREVSYTVSDVSNPQTGQPVIGPGELIVVAGGPFGQNLARFLEDGRIASVRQLLVEDRFEIWRSSDDSVIASMPVAQSTSTNDFVLIELVRDTQSGTMVLLVSGFNEHGTNAGAWYFQNVMMPSLSTLGEGWYSYLWTDAGEPGPDSADEFELLGSGP